MAVGFTTTCAISANRHYSCEFESHLWRGKLDKHYVNVIKFVSDLRQVGGFLWVFWLAPPIELTATI
jgi:hypothetical protein